MVTDAEHGTEGVGAGTQVGDFAQELEGVSLFLQGIYIGVGTAVELDALGLNLGLLTFALRLYQRAYHTDAGTGRDGFHLGLGKLREVDYNLYILNGRTIVECNKVDMLIAPARTHPAFHIDLRPVKRCVEGIDDFGPFHCFHTLSIY